MSRGRDIQLNKFGRLTAIVLSRRDSKSRQIWFCKCDCGKSSLVRRDQLLSGATVSCGCYNREASASRAASKSSRQPMNMFAKASTDFLAANPNLSTGRARTRVGIRCGMNKTESEYALILEGMKRRGEILRYEFEGITLRFANVKYTPDFIVITNPYALSEARKIKFIEVKGPFCKGKFERAVERFRHAKTYWDCFSFELWQKQKTGWKQLI